MLPACPPLLAKAPGTLLPIPLGGELGKYTTGDSMTNGWVEFQVRPKWHSLYVPLPHDRRV